MEVFKIILMIIVSLGIYNVWFVRFNVATGYRGGSATNMIEEFRTYGLPKWSVFVVGFFKVLFATLILVSLFFAPLLPLSVTALLLFMLAALLMHIKVKDKIIKSLPALATLNQLRLMVNIQLLSTYMTI